MTAIKSGIYKPDWASKTGVRTTGLEGIQIGAQGEKLLVTLPAGDLLRLRNEKKTRFTTDISTTTVTLPSAVTVELRRDGTAFIPGATVVQTEKHPGSKQITTPRNATVKVAFSGVAMQYNELPVDVIVGFDDTVLKSSLRFERV